MLFVSMAAALAVSQPADLSATLQPCATAATFEAAATCMVEKLGRDRVSELRTDGGYDPAVYRAIGLTFRLQDAGSPVAASLAAKGYYNADLAPAVLIMMAKARTTGDGRLVDQPDLRRMVAMVNGEQDERRKNWPPASLGTRVELSRCSNIPQRQASSAVCVIDSDGKTAIVTPAPSQPGWLSAPMNKKAD